MYLDLDFHFHMVFDIHVYPLFIRDFPFYILKQRGKIGGMEPKNKNVGGRGPRKIWGRGGIRAISKKE